MASTLTATPLRIEQAPQAFPLVRVLMPEVALGDWLAFAEVRCRAPETSGIVGVRDAQGYFQALFVYEVRPDLAGGATLEVGMAIALGLVDPPSAVAMLVAEIDLLAARLGCAGVHVRLRPDQRRLRRWFEAAGHTLDGVVLGKPIGSFAPTDG
jgi:hypothetical protein